VPRTARDVVFTDGVRTPFGKAGPNGLYAETRADDLVVSVIRELLRRNPALPPSTAGEVRERALEALAEEIRLMLDEGVVAGPEDIDLCMILGAGWPFHLGGITPYLDRAGITEKVTGTRFHP
jgi:acetyl-CoA acetyltransferase